MNKNPTLSIVVPCYNEEKNIPLIYNRFCEVIIDRKDIEVVFVNNGSTDDSKKVFEEFSDKQEYSFSKVIEVQVNKGYGFGIVAGLKACGGDVLSWTHADMQTDPEDVIKALDKFLECNDENLFIKGKRLKRKFLEAFFTWGMQVIASIALGVKLDDINAQPKMFSRSFCEKIIDDAPTDFSLDLYFLYMAGKLNCKIKEIPVFFNKRMHGEAKGGGSFGTRIKLIKRTFKYIFELKSKLGTGSTCPNGEKNA